MLNKYPVLFTSQIRTNSNIIQSMTSICEDSFNLLNIFCCTLFHSILNMFAYLQFINDEYVYIASIKIKIYILFRAFLIKFVIVLWLSPKSYELKAFLETTPRGIESLKQLYSTFGFGRKLRVINAKKMIGSIGGGLFNSVLLPSKIFL